MCFVESARIVQALSMWDSVVREGVWTVEIGGRGRVSMIEGLFGVGGVGLWTGGVSGCGLLLVVLFVE